MNSINLNTSTDNHQRAKPARPPTLSTTLLANGLEALISPPYTPLLTTQSIWDPKASLCSADHAILEKEELANTTSHKKAPLNSCNSVNQSATFASRKRKVSLPQRAISPPRDQVDRSFQRIVTLDVYSAFRANPANLLHRRKSTSSSNESDSEYPGSSDRKSPILPCSTVPSSAALSKKSGSSNNQSACKVLPLFIRDKEPNSMNIDAFKNTLGASTVSWKGAQPLNITIDMVNFDELTTEEVHTCATLRILPSQYIEIKKTLLTAVEAYGPFKKREAQTWFRIDVNKICIIYDWFKTLGWIPNTEEWAGNGDGSKRPSTFSLIEKKKAKRR